MPCPTCDHTLHGLGNRYFHCPRCGTIVRRSDDGNYLTDRSVPKLVERCRKFEETLGPRWGELWRQLGIEESINLPDNRST